MVTHAALDYEWTKTAVIQFHRGAGRRDILCIKPDLAARAVQGCRVTGTVGIELLPGLGPKHGFLAMLGDQLEFLRILVYFLDLVKLMRRESFG